jgi:hypothetical protein
VSRDIPDNLGGLTGSFLGLVVLGGVDRELGEEFAVFGEDAYVAVGDEEHDAGAGIASADAEVPELGLVAEGDDAAGVDAVAADPVLGGDVLAALFDQVIGGLLDAANAATGRAAAEPPTCLPR